MSDEQVKNQNTETPENRDASSPNEIEVDEEFEKLVAERQMYLEGWQRAQAEMENYRKRILREQDQERPFRVLPLAKDLLVGLDNLQRTLDASKKFPLDGTKSNAPQLETLIAGVGMVLKQFEEIFAKHAIQPIEAVGQPFDPNLHEAIQQVASDKHPPYTILQEVERGYRIQDRIIRPTRVVVSIQPTGA